MYRQTCTRCRSKQPSTSCIATWRRGPGVGHTLGRPVYVMLVWLARACGQWQLHLGPVSPGHSGASPRLALIAGRSQDSA
eukprot:11222421-Lingulodinium_polyedra.AAC.1